VVGVLAEEAGGGLEHPCYQKALTRNITMNQRRYSDSVKVLSQLHTPTLIVHSWKELVPSLKEVSLTAI